MTSLSISSFFRNEVQSEKRALLEDISGEEGGADVSVDERAEVLTARHYRRLLLNQEETELAARPVLSWHIPLHGRCAQTHTVNRIQVRPNAIPDPLFPPTLEEANVSHCKALLSPSTREEI